MNNVLLIVVQMGLMFLVGCTTQPTYKFDHTADLARTWSNAKVYLPSEQGPIHVSMKRIQNKTFESVPEKVPLVIYMHGCAGLWQGSDERADFFVEMGFAVIAPDSFARLAKPISCNPIRQIGGLHRGVLQLRQAEALYAISRAQLLPWVDQNSIILMGFSEGGITVATLNENQGDTIRARIIEGWGCHSGWPEYVGINAASNQPVLAMVAKEDPWFKHPSLEGHCGPYLKNEISKSIVYEKPPLSYRHGLLEAEIPRSEIKIFLLDHVLGF